MQDISRPLDNSGPAVPPTETDRLTRRPALAKSAKRQDLAGDRLADRPVFRRQRFDRRRYGDYSLLFQPGRCELPPVKDIRLDGFEIAA